MTKIIDRYLPLFLSALGLWSLSSSYNEWLKFIVCLAVIINARDYIKNSL